MNAQGIPTGTPGLDWLPTTEVSTRIGHTRSNTTRLAREGKLRAVKSGDAPRAKLMFEPGSVAAYVDAHPQRRRAAKVKAMQARSVSPDGGDWLRSSVAAKRLGYSDVSYVSKLVRDGRLRGTKRGRFTFVDPASIEARIAALSKGTAPRQVAQAPDVASRPTPDAPSTGALGRIEALLREVKARLEAVEQSNLALAKLWQ